ncbi:MAG TPA: sulfite exporter TauE/SafE family protein [Bacteroidota bacterium]|nr:sulfite exporter TauE/SafE family protein [Bacteroidota bacterium]
MVFFLTLLFGGFLAGVFGALLGLGGGILLIPYLTLLLGVPMHTAIATSIVSVIATSSAGASVNLERSMVHTRLAMVLEIATVLGALIGGLTSNILSASILAKLFAALLLLVAGMMLHQLLTRNETDAPVADGILPATYFDTTTQQTIPYSVKRLPVTLLVSLVAGNVSGLLGIGGGIFKVPAMHLASRVPMKVATATSNFMIGVTAAASAFLYLAHGHVHPFITASSALGVLVGSRLGATISRKISTRILTWIFTFVLLFIAVQLYFKKG